MAILEEKLPEILALESGLETIAARKTPNEVRKVF